MNEKKLIFLTNRFEIGGTENELVRWSNDLALKGVKSEIWSIQNRVDTKLKESLPPLCHLRVLTKYKTSFAYMYLPFLRKRKWFKGDFLYHITDTWTLIFFMLNAPINSRFNIGVYHRNEFIYREKYLFKVFQGILSTKKRGLLVANDSVAKYYENFYECPQCTTFKPLNLKYLISSDNKLLQRFDIPLTIDVLIVARLVEYKNYLRVTLNELSRYKTKLRVVIVGDGPIRKSLEKDFSHFEFLGSLDALRLEEISKKTKVFIGNGTALLQMAYGGVCSIVSPDSLSDSNEYYGFVSDINFNYSYTEDLFGDQSRFSLFALLDRVLESQKTRMEIIDSSKKNIHSYINNINLEKVESRFFLKPEIDRRHFVSSSIQLLINQVLKKNRLL